MAVKKIHRLVINCVYLCILGLSGVTPEEETYAEQLSQHFVDQTIRMDGAISSVTPQMDGWYYLEINKEAIFTCIPFTTSEPRMRTVSVSLQNRGRHVSGCDCLLQWKPHTGQYQCFCSIPWTFRRYGEENVKCCIDDSYRNSCHHGYTFHINVLEMTTTIKSTTGTIEESTDTTTFLSTFFADEKSTQLSTITFLPSSAQHYTSSIPAFQTDLLSFQNSNGFAVIHWLPALVVVALIGAGLVVILVRIWIKRTSQDGHMPRGTPV